MARATKKTPKFEEPTDAAVKLAALRQLVHPQELPKPPDFTPAKLRKVRRLVANGYNWIDLCAALSIPSDTAIATIWRLAVGQPTKQRNGG